MSSARSSRSPTSTRRDVIREESTMSVAHVIEISATSPQSFEDAIRQGIERANKTLRGVTAAWVGTSACSSRTGGRPSIRLTYRSPSSSKDRAEVEPATPTRRLSASLNRCHRPIRYSSHPSSRWAGARIRPSAGADDRRMVRRMAARWGRRAAASLIGPCFCAAPEHTALGRVPPALDGRSSLCLSINVADPLNPAAEAA